MNEIPVLVKPLDECPEEYEVCYNCGSNLMRVLYKWVILKYEYCKKEEIPKVMLGSVDFYCAVCGKLSSGQDLYEEKDIETTEFEDGRKVILNDFSTRDEAEKFLEDSRKNKFTNNSSNNITSIG